MPLAAAEDAMFTNPLDMSKGEVARCDVLQSLVVGVDRRRGGVGVRRGAEGGTKEMPPLWLCEAIGGYLAPWTRDHTIDRCHSPVLAKTLKPADGEGLGGGIQHCG